MTIGGVKAFQKAKGLEADGVVGPKTRTVLNTICI
jgi:murein L,D-transpeptidase YcbB/YkuD